MNKILKILCICILSGFMGVCMVVPTFAQEKISVTENNVHDLDQFVGVENNQFVLEIPDHVIISDTLRRELIEKNSEINKVIKSENFVINPITKIAKPMIQLRAYGVNNISFTWNSIIIKMDAGLVKIIARAAGSGTMAGVVALLKTFPAIAAFAIAHPVISAGSAAFATSIVGSLLASRITEGVEMHYNFYIMRVTYVKRQ